MKRRFFILLFFAALTAALSPCVEAFSYAWQQQNCEQEMSCCMKKQAEKEKAAGSHCGKHSEDDHGQCSSLCHCSCCGHVVTAFYAFIPMLQSSQEFRQKPDYYSSYHFDYTHFIWQPPRLG